MYRHWLSSWMWRYRVKRQRYRHQLANGLMQNDATIMAIWLVSLSEFMTTWDRCRNSWICLKDQLLRTHTVPVKWVIVEVKGMQQQQHMTIEKIIVGKVLLKGTNFCGGNADMGDLSTTCFFCSIAIANGYYQEGVGIGRTTHGTTAFANQYQCCIEILGGIRWKCSVCSIHEDLRVES